VIPRRARVFAWALAPLCAILAGCSLANGLGPTQPPAITQQLVIRSLERGLAQLDISRFAGRPADVEVYTQAGNQDFIREFVVSWLKAHGLRTTMADPSLRLKVFASVVGTDRGQTFFGVPAFQAPVLNVPVPEIALFKWERNRGLTELRVFAFDGKTEDFVDQLPLGIGRSRADDFTVLLFFGYSWTDVDRPVP